MGMNLIKHILKIGRKKNRTEVKRLPSERKALNERKRRALQIHCTESVANNDLQVQQQAFL